MEAYGIDNGTVLCTIFSDDDFDYTIATDNCFTGLDSETVGESDCNPWVSFSFFFILL